MMAESELKKAGAPSKNGVLVQVKVCGLTRVDEAVACARAGAHAVGCVFYPRSPRWVSVDTARAIRQALPQEVACVGVFVDEPFERVVATASRAGLAAVQLHGSEPPEVVRRLRREGLYVIKALFADRAPGIDEAPRYSASAYLVECGRGRLPGGNAQPWEWGRARALGERHPLVLAGGLTPENAAQAVHAAGPDAVDASSGVEAAPGRKDIGRVEQLIAAVATAVARRRIFA